MNTRRWIIVPALIVLAVALLIATRTFGPVVGVPGGALSGSGYDCPDRWGTSSDVTTVQLETRPASPYSVNLWGVGIGGDFYVSTRAEGTGWSRNVDANPSVRLRVGQIVCQRKAARVTDGAERKRVLEAYVRKYDVDPDDFSARAGLIYRLDPR